MNMSENFQNHWRNHVTNVSGYIKRKSLQTGDKCDKYLDTISDKKKYVCEVLLLVPLIFIIHQWLLLSPYSSYWVIDCFLFLLKYGMALVLTGTWAFNTGLHFQTFTYLFMDIAVAWIRQVSYWSHQDEAHEICHENNVLVWSDVTDSWWIPALVSFLIQFVYTCYRPGTILCRDTKILPWVFFAALITLVPELFSMVGIFASFMSELSYWIQSVVFCLICFFEVGSSFEIGAEIDEKKIKELNEKIRATENEDNKQNYRNKIQRLQEKIKERKNGGNIANLIPRKWFARDILIAFGLPYLMFAFLFELLIYQRGLTSMFTLDTQLELTAAWCTTQIVVLCYSYGLGMLSNFGVAVSHFFLTGEVNIVEAFDANIGGIVQLSSLIGFTEATILSLEYDEKVEAMKFVALLSAYNIVFQILDVLQQKVLHAVNSGTSPGLPFYLRVGILTGLLVTAPTLSTLVMSKKLNVSPWLLFFASGNCTIIIRMICLLLECGLVTLTWHITEYLSKLEDILHYFRVSRSAALALLLIVQCYCRYMCPFLKGFWLFRLCLAFFSCIALVTAIVWLEIIRYRSRNKMVTLLNNLPTKTFNLPPEMDGDEREHECAICYSVMTNGISLPCTHVFHKDCLRRWFQVKTVCPLCNTNIMIDQQPAARKAE